VTALLLGVLLVQATGAEALAPADLTRIRKALDGPAPVSLAAATVRRDGLVFTATVEAFALGDAWDDRSGIPAYVRSWHQSYHHEFLNQVTTEEFRTATAYPLGLPIDRIAAVLTRHIRAARRASRERRARHDVGQELAAFLACRADPSKPGC
jgi:hypothetical protein